MAADGKVTIVVASDTGDVENLSQTIEKSLSGVDKAAQSTGKSLKDSFLIGSVIGIAQNAIQAIGGSIKGLIGEAISASDAMDKFRSTMKFAGFNDKEIKTASKSVKKYADDTVYDLSTVSNTTAQLAANGVKNYTGLTEAAGNLNAAAGGNADSFKSVAMMLTQTAGAGKLTTENWNQLTDAIPGASGKLQEAMLKNGAYTGNFRDAMEKGEITADEFNKAIMDLGMTDAAKEAATSTKTFEGAFGSLEANVVSGLNNIINSVGKDNLTSLINDISNAAVWMFGVVVKGLQTAIPIIKQMIGFVKEHAKAFEVLGTVVATVVGGMIVFGTIGKILSSVSTAATTLLSPFKLLGSLSTSNASAFSLLGTGAGEAASNLVKFGLGALEIGAAIGLTTAGIGLMAMGIAQLASSGTSGLIALTAMTLAVSALAGVFALLGPLLTANALGIGVFGAAILAIGVGVGAASAGIALLINAISALGQNLTLIIPTMTAIGIGFASMITGFVTALASQIPAVSSAIVNMVTNMLTTIANAMPQFIESGMTIILSILNGIAQNIGQITNAALDVMINFLNALANKMPDVIESAATLIANFVNGIANNLEKIIASAVNLIVQFLEGIAGKIPDVVNAAMNLVDALVQGLLDAQGRLMDAAIVLINGFADNIRNRQEDMRSAALNLLDAIRGVFVPDALWNAGKSIIDGFLGGLRSAFENVKDFVSGIADWIKEHKGPISYDKRLLIPAGKAIMQSLDDGLNDQFKSVQQTISDIATSIPSGIALGVNTDANQAIRAVNKMNKEIMNVGYDSLTPDKVTGIQSSKLSSGNATSAVTQNSNSKVINNTPEINISVHVEKADDIEKTINDINWRDIIAKRGALE